MTEPRTEAGPSIQELLAWNDRCENLPGVRAAIERVLRGEGEAAAPESSLRPLITPQSGALRDALDMNGEPITYPGRDLLGEWGGRDPETREMLRAKIRDIEIDAMARGLCYSHEPDPAEAGMTIADIHVDDECRAQARAALAKPEPAGLDVERLARALIQSGLYIDDTLASPQQLAEWIAREYERDAAKGDGDG